MDTTTQAKKGSDPERGLTPFLPDPSDEKSTVLQFHTRPPNLDRSKTVVRLPSYDQVVEDNLLYAHASRVFHQETNPGNARALVQQHGKRDVWLNPPPIPLTTKEFDQVFELPYR